ncbi:uncharacterized protein LOC111692037, partial [Anoplophora glabripennis]|uniref:uncharacterized protein LOC111692037 n=1 Tax=Anoplophora glabripennis TaxID=217634 RepID=UPI000C767E87
MAMIGSIEKFNPKESDITSYLERLEQLFICNAVEADKKVAMLLTLLGGEAYNVLKDLLAPDLPSTRTYVELKKVLSDHYSPKRLIIAERYKFYNAIQEGNEDIKMFVAKLKNLSQYCSFGQFLSECLRDRLVCGVRSYAIKRKLLSEDNLTFESAYKTALAMELAEGQIKSMGGENNVLSVAEELDKLFVKKKVFKNESKSSQSKEGGTQWRPCFRCLRKHDPNNCPAKGWECFKCKKKGHTSRVCKSPNVNAVEEVEGEESSQDDSLVLGFLSVLGSMKEDAEKAVLDLEVQIDNNIKFVHLDNLRPMLNSPDTSVVLEYNAANSGIMLEPSAEISATLPVSDVLPRHSNEPNLSTVPYIVREVENKPEVSVDTNNSTDTTDSSISASSPDKPRTSR